MTGKGYAPRAQKPFPIMGTALLPRMIMEDSGAGRLHPTSEMHDRASSAPGRLIVEWAAQL